MAKTPVLFLLVLCFFISPAYGDHRPDNVEIPVPRLIESKHVYALSGLIEKELESIRFIMGRPKATRVTIHIKYAEPREVYFQAASLYNKTKRLYFQLLSESSGDLPAAPKDIRSENIWNVLRLTLDQLQSIKKEYGLTVNNTFPDIADDKTPSEVYLSILSNIRQLNQLLEQPYTPSDVYQEITTAFYCTLDIFKRVPGLKMRNEPAFVPGKVPGDVYFKILKVYMTLSEIMRLKGLHALELTVSTDHDIRPGDVYDLAVLITSELKYLHAEIPDTEPVNNAVYPGIKFPSHVYQRVSYLHDHLKMVLEELKKDTRLLNLRN